jgi:nucleoside-diphosphate-sugar epimerase
MTATVLLTGASSFTGLWIAEALAARGYAILAPLRRSREAYDGVRRDRVARLEAVAEVVFDCPFGSPAMLDLIRGAAPIESLAHHAADVEGYRDPAFDAVAAFGRNMLGAEAVLELLRERGARQVLLTGSVFEAGEGGDPAHGEAVTPYGLSKTLTSIALRHQAEWRGLRFGRFVIPSPYGVFEERRFGWHLFRTWFSGDTPEVRTPHYVRDHLPAPVLAQAYAHYLDRLRHDDAAPAVARPSGWIAAQGAFARRVAAEAERRLGRACPLRLAGRHPLEEPYLRVNSEPAIPPDWDEARFWDDYVGWYEELNRDGRLG